MADIDVQVQAVTDRVVVDVVATDAARHRESVHLRPRDEDVAEQCVLGALVAVAGVDVGGEGLQARGLGMTGAALLAGVNVKRAP